MLVLRAVLFTLLVPGTIIVYLPLGLAKRWPSPVDLGLFRFVGLVLIFTGLFFLLASIFTFITKGKGTPAIWFTKPIRVIVGEEPQKLVLNSLYQFTRNPMYVGAVTIVLGEAFWFAETVLFIYSAVLWLYFHLIIVVVEEPHLKDRDGEEYEAYCRHVPRWIGLRKTDN